MLKKASLAGMLVLAFGTVASAATIQTWDSVDNGNGTITNILLISHDSGEAFLSSQMRIDTPAGGQIHVQGGFPAGPTAQINSAADTGAYPGYTGAPLLVALHNESATYTETDFLYGGGVSFDVPGEVYRITLADDASGSVNVLTRTTAPFQDTTGSFTISNGVVAVPEPGALALLALGAMAVIRRR